MSVEPATTEREPLLLVEDDPDVQLIAKIALKRAGFDVAVASGGVDGIAQATARRPAVILLDWMMPDVDGLETCARLKANAATQDVPVIFLTARSQEAEIRRGLQLGAIGYITKPFDALDLGARVRALLDRAARPPGPAGR